MQVTPMAIVKHWSLLQAGTTDHPTVSDGNTEPCAGGCSKGWVLEPDSDVAVRCQTCNSEPAEETHP